jgi:release factor glutamine methyltransferase
MATPQDPWTIRRLLEWTENYFKSKSQESPRLEAQILLAHTLKCPKIELYTRPDFEPTEEVRTQFRELIKKRVEGCPVAYLVGYREFHSLNFEVNSAVLIPRPETELLIVEADRLLKSKPEASVLDLGSGSGNIPIALAHSHKKVKITSVDISSEALEVARRNAAKHQVESRIEFVQSDLFASIPEGTQFDLIVSNPPYITPAEFESLPVGVKNFEPKLALLGGADGLDFYRRIASAAKRFLAPGGSLLLEIGYTQGEAVTQLLRENGFAEVRLLQDHARHPRVVVAR